MKPSFILLVALEAGPPPGRWLISRRVDLPSSGPWISFGTSNWREQVEFTFGLLQLSGAEAGEEFGGSERSWPSCEIPLGRHAPGPGKPVHLPLRIGPAQGDPGFELRRCLGYQAVPIFSQRDPGADFELQAGLVTQTTTEFEARIALGRSDAQRQVDRLAWAGRMAAKGYLAEGQLLSERQTLARLRHELKNAAGEFHLFRQFEVPKEIHGLRGQIHTAEINQRLAADRLKAEEDELAYLRKQIANCTIRAPQDGVVVYANRSRWWSLPLEPGTKVYEGQSMFLIPDLTKLEVNVSVHESMGPRVRVGMKAQVSVASRPSQVISGQVVAIDMLSTPNWKEWDDNVRHFIARVRLDQTPASALPFMSATVEIHTGRITDASLSRPWRQSVVRIPVTSSAKTAVDQDAANGTGPAGGHRGPAGGRTHRITVSRCR